MADSSGSMADNVATLARLATQMKALQAQFDTFTNGAVNEAYTTTDGRTVQSLSTIQDVLLSSTSLLSGANINGGGAAQGIEYQLLAVDGGKA